MNFAERFIKLGGKYSFRSLRNFTAEVRGQAGKGRDGIYRSKRLIEVIWIRGAP